MFVRKEANVMIEVQKTWRGHRQNQKERERDEKEDRKQKDKKTNLMGEEEARKRK